MKSGTTSHASAVHPGDGPDEEPSENSTESFIVRVWLEETAVESRRAPWRGHITHVPTGDRRYIQDLRGIATFIAYYLDRMQAQLQFWWRIERWWKRQRSLRKSQV